MKKEETMIGKDVVVIQKFTTRYDQSGVEQRLITIPFVFCKGKVINESDTMVEVVYIVMKYHDGFLGIGKKDAEPLHYYKWFPKNDHYYSVELMRNK